MTVKWKEKPKRGGRKARSEPESRPATPPPSTSPSPFPASTLPPELSAAYERIGIHPAAVATQPAITPILDAIPPSTIRDDDGDRTHGVAKAIQFLRASTDTEAQRFISLYDSLTPSVRALLPVEAFCVALEIPTRRMLEVITSACFDQSTATSTLIAAAAHPAVVESTVAGALFPGKDGAKDREMLHKARGFLPVPKNNVAHFHGSVNVDNREQIANINVGELGRTDKAMRAIEEKFNEKRNRDLDAVVIPDDRLIGDGGTGEEDE